LDVVVAEEGAKVPSEREHVTPEGIVHQLTEDTIHIGRLDMVSEISKPGLCHHGCVHVRGHRHSQPFQRWQGRAFNVNASGHDW
jgi:hypothetical protein